MAQAGNRLIAALDDAERARWEPFLERVEVQPRQELFGREESLGYLWFPEGGAFSQVMESSGGGSVDVMTIGREGAVGLPALFGADSAVRVIAHVAATALRMRVDDFARLAEGRHTLMRHVEQYTALLLSCLPQISACNALHHTEQRLCRWLLLARDRTGTNALPITHDILALMLGTRRASVTRAAQRLQRRGCIRYERGVVHYTDVSELERMSCECCSIVRRLHETFKNLSTSPTIWHY